jgi:nucleoid-associated protein YgaU
MSPNKRDEILNQQKDLLNKQKEKQEKTTHIVQAGDTLSALATKYYGDAGKYLAIYEANKEVIGDDPDLIKEGQELVIPKAP